MDGSGCTILLRGETGTGKTHLTRYLVGEAARKGFTVASGQAYRAEAGAPFALFTDAFLPLLSKQTPETLTVLSRGGMTELERFFPGLGSSPGHDLQGDSDSPREARTRVLWTFREVLARLADREPICITLENIHWADPSSLEAIHFLARQLTDSRVFFLLTRDDLAPEMDEALLGTERSLLSHGIATEIRLPPFTREETGQLLKEAFGVGEDVAADFADHVHAWTQGNPFFLEETLQGLVRSGSLYKKGGAWLGWETRALELPATVKEAILLRLSQLPEGARGVADLVAVLGGRAPLVLLRALGGLSDEELLQRLELLVDRRVLDESLGESGVTYQFRQNLVRETLIKEMGLARSQLLHGRIARALEDHYGDRAGERADALAYHYLRAGGEDTPQALTHLVRAGREALSRFGNAEAARYLRAALDLMDRRESRDAALTDEVGGRRKVLEDLARAYSRMGAYGEAVPLWETARRMAEEEGAWDDVGESWRRIGIIRSYNGDPLGALEAYDEALALPPDLMISPNLVAKTRLRRGVALEELGRLEEAREELEQVLRTAEELNDPVVLAQAHRALVLLHIWTGNPDRVRDHGKRAMELARISGALSVEFWTHWGLAVLEGLLGNTQVMAEHVREANRVADELHSPLLKLRSAELAIEEAAATGAWESGIIIGEQAIALARSLSQNTILPRLLVWTALIYLSRGEIELGRPLVEEAWEVAGGGKGDARNVHAEIPAYIGRGYLALAEGDTQEAIRIGREALQIADQVGYGLWAIHRLVPLLAEAYLWQGDLEGAREMGHRLRSGSSPIQHKLGLAWGHTCDALVTWLDGDPVEGARMMEEAAQALEAVPMIGDAARLRRLKAGRLADLGDRSGALEELGKVHEIFLRMGAEVELERTRIMFRELNARPPRRSSVGEGELSHRETEIARLVEARKSNKAIAKELGISPRTVSTHLSNIYQKLGISSRGELADYIRLEGLPDE